MSTNSALDPEVDAAIKTYCALGDEFVAGQNYSLAIGEYNKAWMLIPEPKNHCQASAGVLVAIADACFRSRYYVSARDALAYAMTCPGATGMPLLHLRYGQVLHYFGEFGAATDQLERAYVSGGVAIFSNEDAKYFQFLSSRINVEMK